MGRSLGIGGGSGRQSKGRSACGARLLRVNSWGEGEAEGARECEGEGEGEGAGICTYTEGESI